jgi:hypothetical protein
MASIKYTGVVHGIAGSIAGTTFQRGRSTSIVRNKTSFRNGFNKSMRTSVINIVKAKFSYTTSAWRGLSDVQRAAYTAAAPSFPFTNKWGDTYTGSGYQLFCWQNFNLFSVASDFNNTPPVVTEFPDTVSLSLTASAPNSVYLSWGFNIPADWGIIIYSCPIQSAGANNLNSKRNRLLCTADNTIDHLNFGEQFVGKYGNIKDGTRIAVWCRFVHLVYGVSTPLYSISAISGS